MGLRQAAVILFLFINCIATTVQSEVTDSVNKIKFEFPEYSKKPFYQMTFQKTYPIIFREEPIVYIQAALGAGGNNAKKIIELENALDNFGWKKAIINKSSLEKLIKTTSSKNKVYILRVHRVSKKVNDVFLPLKDGLIWSYSIRSFDNNGKIYSLRGGVALSIPVVIEQLNQGALNVSEEAKNKVAEVIENSKPSKKQAVIEAVKDLIKE